METVDFLFDVRNSADAQRRHGRDVVFLSSLFLADNVASRRWILEQISDFPEVQRVTVHSVVADEIPVPTLMIDYRSQADRITTSIWNIVVWLEEINPDLAPTVFRLHPRMLADNGVTPLFQDDDLDAIMRGVVYTLTASHPNRCFSYRRDRKKITFAIEFRRGVYVAQNHA